MCVIILVVCINTSKKKKNSIEISNLTAQHFDKLFFSNFRFKVFKKKMVYENTKFI